MFELICLTVTASNAFRLHVVQFLLLTGVMFSFAVI